MKWTVTSELSMYAKPVVSCFHYRRSALHICASSAHYLECVHVLVEHGAKIRLVDCNGIRPIDLEKVDICDLLLTKTQLVGIFLKFLYIKNKQSVKVTALSDQQSWNYGDRQLGEQFVWFLCTKKIKGTCLIDCNSENKLWIWGLAHYLSYVLRRLVRCSVNSTSTHRFTQEGLEMVTLT